MMVVLLLVGMSTSALNIQPVKASGPIYIRADGSIDPPMAPISTLDNITYTFTDNINDPIVVERSNIVMDGAGYTLQGTGSGYGFYWYGINNVTIKNTNIKNFVFGIWLGYSSDNSISGNNITANNLYGIYLYSSSNNNSISGNNITANNLYGIWLWSSSSNSISGNNITNNSDGIWLGYFSNNNSISGNNITANAYEGIFLGYSSNNRFYHNSLIGNTQQVYFGTTGYASVWDDGYPSGGNYWSNYTGVDLYRGSGQNETGSDGIGDSAHTIDENNTDRYPLMSPFVLGDMDRDSDIDEDDLWHFCAAFVDYYKIHVLDPLCDFDKDNDIDEDDLWTMAGAFIDYWKAH
jgi:parallel beta-helix repeat protein